MGRDKREEIKQIQDPQMEQRKGLGRAEFFENKCEREGLGMANKNLNDDTTRTMNEVEIK